MRLSNIYFLSASIQKGITSGLEVKLPYRVVRPGPQPVYRKSTISRGAIYYPRVARQALVVLIVVVTFGILVPWYRGFTLLDPRILAAYACLALLFVAPATAELSGDLQAKMSNSAILARIGLIVAYGWAVTVVILATALVTLNLTNRRGILITPPWALCTALLAFSLAGSTTVATASATLARYVSAAGAKSVLRGLFLLVLMVLAFSSRLLPESWQIVLSDYTGRRAMTRLAWEASGVAVVLTGLLMIPLIGRSNATHQSSGTDPV